MPWRKDLYLKLPHYNIPYGVLAEICIFMVSHVLLLYLSSFREYLSLLKHVLRLQEFVIAFPYSFVLHMSVIMISEKRIL